MNVSPTLSGPEADRDIGHDELRPNRRTRWRVRGPAVVATVGLVAALLTVPAPAAAAATPSPTAPVVNPTDLQPESEEAAALAKARATGKPVEVTGQRNATTQVYANPSGTLTAEVHARPVRVKRYDGSWVPVDMTLRRTGGGGVVPTATPTPVRFSGGGDEPLVTIYRDGKALSLTWPGRLAAPTLRGDTATYPEVLPGVDLVVRAYDDGFAKALVVKTPAAARNPALAKIRFAVGGSGITVRPRSDGSFVAVDKTGKELFGASTPSMWDSSGPVDGKVDTEEEQRDRIAGPGSALHRSVLPVRFADGHLELTPDQAMLADPGTKFPVYIDPSVTVDLSYWTMINGRFRNQSYWSYDRSSGAKVGYVEDYADGWEKYRSLFRFPISSFASKHVIDVEFSATLYHSYYCTKSRADLYHVVTGFNSSTNWENSTPWYSQYFMDNASGQSCSSTGDVRMEWSSSALTGVADSATGTYLILGLRSYDESTINAGWKKFKPSSAKLSVTYNTPPKAPSKITINGHGCVQGADRPIIGSTSPKLTAYLSDPDSADTMDVRFYWVPLGGTKTTTNSIVRGPLANNATMVINEGTGFPDGALESGMTYYVQGYARDNSPVRDRSPDSAICEFTVDVTRPENMPQVISTDYPADDAYHKGVGQTGSFTFDPNGVTDVVLYEYHLEGQPVQTVAAGADGTATIKLTPEIRGSNTLFVRSKDAAGNPSDWRQDYAFNVGSPTPPQAHWTMSEESGTTLLDSSGNGNDATVFGTTSRTAGRVGIGGPDRALGLDGSGYASTPNPVVDTAKSFAVAVWVRSDWASGMVVSIEGPESRAFYLGYDANDYRWAFAMVDSQNVQRAAVSTEYVADTVWTHLAGTFDEATGKLRLYVNGKLSSTATNTSPRSGSGPTVIGGIFPPYGSEYFAGAVDDVRIWNRMAYASEFEQITNEATLVGQWLFDGDVDPAVATDTSGYAHPATLTGAIARGPGYDGTDGLVGSGGWARTDGPVMLTDQSFTVAARVRLTDLTASRTAVSQADDIDWWGTNADSAFRLEYDRGSGKWALSVPWAAPDRATSTTAPAAGEWTHLVGVYDAVKRQLRIYVNGQLEGTASTGDSGPWNADGGLHLGASVSGGSVGNAWQGGLDDVWVFTGVLNDLQIQNLFAS